MLDSSKLKESVDDKFWLDGDDRKKSSGVKNTVEKKREIARDEQFLFCPLCFKKTCAADT